MDNRHTLNHPTSEIIYETLGLQKIVVTIRTEALDANNYANCAKLFVSITLVYFASG